jgi:hypothetical protein
MHTWYIHIQIQTRIHQRTTRKKDATAAITTEPSPQSVVTNAQTVFSFNGHFQNDATTLENGGNLMQFGGNLQQDAFVFDGMRNNNDLQLQLPQIHASNQVPVQNGSSQNAFGLVQQQPDTSLQQSGMPAQQHGAEGHNYDAYDYDAASPIEDHTIDPPPSEISGQNSGQTFMQADAEDATLQQSAPRSRAHMNVNSTNNNHDYNVSNHDSLGRHQSVPATGSSTTWQTQLPQTGPGDNNASQSTFPGTLHTQTAHTHTVPTFSRMSLAPPPLPQTSLAGNQVVLAGTPPIFAGTPPVFAGVSASRPWLSDSSPLAAPAVIPPQIAGQSPSNSNDPAHAPAHIIMAASTRAAARTDVVLFDEQPEPAPAAHADMPMSNPTSSAFGASTSLLAPPPLATQAFTPQTALSAPTHTSTRLTSSTLAPPPFAVASLTGPSTPFMQHTPLLSTFGSGSALAPPPLPAHILQGNQSLDSCPAPLRIGVPSTLAPPPLSAAIPASDTAPITTHSAISSSALALPPLPGLILRPGTASHAANAQDATGDQVMSQVAAGMVDSTTTLAAPAQP